MPPYDKATTVFSPDGQLLQVQYALEAVHRGSPVVGIRGPNVVVIAVEKRMVENLELRRTEKKIAALDKHVMLGFAGLRADARVILTRARIECQSYRLIVEEPVSVEYISRYIAQLKQSYTQRNGRRPFGISCVVGGFDTDGTARLYQTDPSGIYHEWKAATTGKHENMMREYLERNYKVEAVATESGAIKLAISTLLEGVRSGPKNFDVAVLKRDEPVKMLEPESIKTLIEEIEAEEKEKAKIKDKIPKPK